MKLTYNTINNKDINSSIYPFIDEEHLEKHQLDDNDLNELDKFYKIICEIIDDCDSILVQFDEKLINKYKKHLQYKCYDYIEGLNLGYITDNYIFDICNSESKKYLKDNIDFDIYQYDDTQAELYPEIDRKYLYKKDTEPIGTIIFIKKNEVLYQLERFLGRIVCFENFNTRKYKNILKKNININQKQFLRKYIFTFDEVENDNLILKKYILNLLYEINLNNIVIEHYNGELLKDKRGYGYYDLYINNKLKSKIVFRLFFGKRQESYLDKFYEVILNDIKSNRDNTYYFNNFEGLNEYICLILNLKDGKVEEVRDEDAIKQFTKKK